ncbi:hypothetical protein JMUB6875_48760 [Nocardia sp. JMUB6875]|uniref:DUF5994 family protein n=1 Tax=Nocardia sp. JMUB6875 TaxID=3158170 RepID=UPI0032E7E4C8
MIVFEDVLRKWWHDQSVGRLGPPGLEPRLRLAPRGEDVGYIDGVWWPRSGDLAAELPNLLMVLARRLGPARRVVYDRTSWSRAHGRLVLGERTIQLDAYPFELGNTLYVFGRGGGMIVLRVIGSTTDQDIARAILSGSEA